MAAALAWTKSALHIYLYSHDFDLLVDYVWCAAATLEEEFFSLVC